MYDYDPSDGEVDVIFAGGGTAACVAAARLARAAPDLRFLIIEGGRNNLDDPTVVNPVLFMAHLMPGSTTALVRSAYLGSFMSMSNCFGHALT
jgi:alcohol oxidase